MGSWLVRRSLRSRRIERECARRVENEARAASGSKALPAQRGGLEGRDRENLRFETPAGNSRGRTIRDAPETIHAKQRTPRPETAEDSTIPDRRLTVKRSDVDRKSREGRRFDDTRAKTS